MNVGVLLAAGAGTRMGESKAGVRWKGQSFLAHGVRALWSGCEVVIAVLGSQAAAVRSGAEAEFEKLVESGALTADLHAAKGIGARALELRFETNRAWKRGMFGSARVGLAAAVKARPSSVFVLPVDHPEVGAETVCSLAAVMADAMGSFGKAGWRDFTYALVPRYKGRRGHPLVLTPALARAIAKDDGAEDLGDAVKRNARLVGYLDVNDKGILVNRNTKKR